MADEFDASKEPLRSFRDLVTMCEEAGLECPELDNARRGFAALRTLFGDHRLNENVAHGPLIEPPFVREAARS